MQETVLVLNRILWDLNTESPTRTAPVNQSHSSSCQSLPQPLAQPRTPTRSAAVRSWNGILTSHTANYSPPEGHTRSGAEQALCISDGSERSAPALRTARSGSEGLAHSASRLHRFSTPGTPLTRRRFLDAAEARSSALCRNGAAATDSRPSHGQVRGGHAQPRPARTAPPRPRSARCPEPSPAPRSTPARQSAAQQGGRPLRLRAQPPTLAGLPAAARSATQHSGGGPRRGRPRRCSLPGGRKAAAGRGLRGSADSRSGPRRSRRNIAAQPGGRARKPDRPNTRPTTAGALLLKGTGARLGRLLCKGEGAPRRAVWWQREGRSLSWRSSAAPWVGGINLSAGGASPPGVS